MEGSWFGYMDPFGHIGVRSYNSEDDLANIDVNLRYIVIVGTWPEIEDLGSTPNERNLNKMVIVFDEIMKYPNIKLLINEKSMVSFKVNDFDKDEFKLYVKKYNETLEAQEIFFMWDNEFVLMHYAEDVINKIGHKYL